MILTGSVLYLAGQWKGLKWGTDSIDNTWTKALATDHLRALLLAKTPEELEELFNATETPNAVRERVKSKLAECRRKMASQ